MTERITYKTKAWPRGQSSVATTIPQPLRMIKGAPPAENLEIHWSVNPDTGAVEVEFVERDENGEDDE
ncbi:MULTISPECIES: hypothetical protein [Haloferax]|uniref:Uncharacterized protein n=1 Tax=Haloferax marinum TaxID=2666143 RepID=A0A6A8G7T1_9EURY|nr:MULTISPECIES: hypothetical protein [Haloferax]KAB1198122.1 hypothetical protein Hfx1150_11565 [Haloferax sp. CBA1150]MRW97199.1 hypothetical protein [Haloferax marinum]